MISVKVQKEIDADLANSGGSLNLVNMGGLSRSYYPKNVTAILLSDTQAGGATHAPINLRLTGSRDRVVLRLQTGVIHYMNVSEVFVEHTDVNGLVVFGPE